MALGAALFQHKGVEILRAKDPDLARTYLYGKLLGALLVDELTLRSRRFFPWGFPLPD